jgi:hypothetical protein
VLDDPLAHCALLTGHGIEAGHCCAGCVRIAERGQAPPLVEVCEGCCTRRADDEDGHFSGRRGEPGVAERPGPVDGTLLETPLPAELGEVLDVAGVPGRRLVLTADARLVLVDPATGAGTEVTRR